MSFLNKVKKKSKVKNVNNAEEKPVQKNSAEEAGEHLQLDVDIYQTPSKIVVFAPIAGVKIDQLDIFVESENDVITISGKKEPAKLVRDDDEEKEYLCRENSWGEFYRQIILPEEVDVAKIESIVESGVLVLKMPLLNIRTKGKKRIEVKESEAEA